MKNVASASAKKAKDEIASTLARMDMFVGATHEALEDVGGWEDGVPTDPKDFDAAGAGLADIIGWLIAQNASIPDDEIDLYAVLAAKRIVTFARVWRRRGRH
jgi:hypothetical protein